MTHDETISEIPETEPDTAPPAVPDDAVPGAVPAAPALRDLSLATEQRFNSETGRMQYFTASGDEL